MRRLTRASCEAINPLSGKGHWPEAAEHRPNSDVADRIDIDQLLLKVDRHTHFLKAFEHLTRRYQREKAKTTQAIVAMPTEKVDVLACARWFSQAHQVKKMITTMYAGTGSHMSLRFLKRQQ